MKVAVLGATGRAGSEITRELVRRGHEVLAVSRKTADIAGAKTVVGDAADPALAPQLAGCEAIISALHHDIPAATILALAKDAGVPRLLVTGGAGSLMVGGQRLIDSPDFPEEFRPFAEKGVVFLDDLRAETAVDWTFVSPAALIFEGMRTGSFRLGTDELVVDANGDSRISFADFAIVMTDELERPQHPRGRFTAAY